MDAVCAPESPALSTVPEAVYVSQPEPTRSHPLEPEPEPSQTPSTVSVFVKSEPSTTGGISLPIGKSLSPASRLARAQSELLGRLR